MRRTLLLFVLYHSIQSVYSQPSDFWNIRFEAADSIAEAHAHRDLKNIEKLAHDLTVSLTTDAEKFRAIFRWITDNISYDVKLYNENERKKRKYRYNKKKLKAWEKAFERATYRRTLTKKLAVCSGYAKLLEQMARHAGLNCVSINGYSRTVESVIGKGSVDHGWNAVQLDGKWYLCDATWASGYYDRVRDKFIRQFDRHYFLTDPSLFIANHYPKDPSWTLMIDRPTLKEFLNAPIKTQGYLTNKINFYSPSAGIVKTKKGESVRFDFTSNRITNKLDAVVSLRSNKIRYDKQYVVKKDKEGKYFIECDLFQKKGTYLVSIYIHNNLTFIYNVYVK